MKSAVESKYESETVSEAVSDDDFDSDSGLATAQYCLWLSKEGCKRSLVGRSLGGKVRSLLRKSLGVSKTAIVIRCIDIYVSGRFCLTAPAAAQILLGWFCVMQHCG
jgi:hypothetical protein